MFVSLTSKVFDTVKHESMIQLLQSLDINSQDGKLPENLYWNRQICLHGKPVHVRWKMRTRRTTEKNIVKSAFTLLEEVLKNRSINF